MEKHEKQKTEGTFENKNKKQKTFKKHVNVRYFKLNCLKIST